MSYFARKNWSNRKCSAKLVASSTSTTQPLAPFYYHWYYKCLSNHYFLFQMNLMGVGSRVGPEHRSVECLISGRKSSRSWVWRQKNYFIRSSPNYSWFSIHHELPSFEYLIFWSWVWRCSPILPLLPSRTISHWLSLQIESFKMSPHVSTRLHLDDNLRFSLVKLICLMNVLLRHCWGKRISSGGNNKYRIISEGCFGVLVIQWVDFMSFISCRMFQPSGYFNFFRLLLF